MALDRRSRRTDRGNRGGARRLRRRFLGARDKAASERVLRSIRRLLDGAGVEYDLASHEAVRTAEEAAAARGCPVEMGAKSIVLKTDDDFRLFVLSGARALKSSLIRRHLGVSRTRFATARELERLTGVKPGAVPPFGHPVLPLELFVDPGLLEYERIAFTPGVRTVSILMASDDYRRLAEPQVFTFGREA